MAQFIDPFPGLLEEGILTPTNLVQALRQAHAAEGEAIHLYKVLAEHTDNKLVIKILESIAREEQVHLGELQQLIDQLDKDEISAREEGRKEVQDALKSGEKSSKASYGGLSDYYRFLLKGNR